jgi:hypothetical protein
VAIYETGGHFQTHRDTVHSPDHKATLLIEVRADHKGSILKLNKNDSEIEWDLASPEEEEEEEEEVSTVDEFMIDPTKPQQIKKKPDPKEVYSNQPLNWILFYTDIEHSISPVTEGVRMVLQFDVYNHSGESEEEEEVEDDTDDDSNDDYECESEYEDIFEASKSLPQLSAAYGKKEIISKIITILENQTTSEQALVVPYYFLYSSQSLLPRQLKSIDQQLFNNLVKAGFTVAVVSILLTATTDYETGKFSLGEVTGDIDNPPFKVYQRDPSTHDIVSKVVKYVPSSNLMIFAIRHNT